MIKKILIANRGEIATRIIATAQRMGIRTVAVYSSADKNSNHVKYADEAYLLGDPSPRDSYLNIGKIIEIAGVAGAHAIHPGYGFLAENPQFALECQQNDLVFIGPNLDAIKKMGLKSTARTIAAKAGVPLLPGLEDFDLKDKQLADQLQEMGFPLLLKPSAGGGGKGMRIVRSMDEFEASIQGAQRESLSSFGDDHLIVEKYLEGPRHIEFQIFGDSMGNYVHLNERDCSLQRRHQKIIEESPAPGFSEQLRKAMGESAIRLAREINYLGAGTVEFLLDQDNNYYFMEMNTRLQVEHPVTEKITGFDLVEWQINIARGETLPVDQSAVGLKGHAIEARIYAEDPANNFLPASGKITHLQLPDESPELRVDNGTAVNETVGVFYDPMMMKVIGWGSSRDACISNLTVALGQLQVAGISTNRDFLIGMLNDKVFKAGGITTNYLDSLSSLSSLSPQSGEITEEVRSKQKAREVKDGGGDDEDKKSDLETDLALCAASLYITRLLPNRFNAEPLSPWDSLIGFRINQPAEAIIPLRFSGESYHLNIFNRSTFNASGMNAVCIKLDNRQYDLHLNNSSQRIAFSWQGQPFHYGYHQSGDYLTLFSDRRTFEVQLRDDYTQTILEEEGRLQAPMSGKIIEILAKSGEQVSKGQALIVMEAMKMEHTIIAPSNGRIKALNLAVDDLVEEGIALMEFEPDDTGVDIG